jgi:MFS family permease
MERHWNYRSTVITLCMLAFFATMVARLVISPVVPYIIKSFNATNSVIGLALTGMWMAYACAQFPSGVLADRYGERLIILAAVGLTAIASALLAIAPSIPVFVLLTVVLGGVAGLHYSVATTFLTRKFDNIGTAIGLHNSGAPLAGLLAPLAAAAVGAWIGWRFSIALGTLVAVPVVMVFAWKIRPTEPARPNQPLGERFAFESVKRLLTQPRIAFTAMLAVLFEFIWQATASFLPSFLIASHGYSVALASMLFSAYFIVHGITQPGIGSLSDRYGREEVTGVCAALGIVGYGLLVVRSGLGASIVAILCIGTAMSWGAALLPRFMDTLSAAERGAGFGLVRTAYMIVSATGSFVVGVVADLAGWNAAFGIFIVLLLFASLALIANRLLDLGL